MVASTQRICTIDSSEWSQDGALCVELVPLHPPGHPAEICLCRKPLRCSHGTGKRGKDGEFRETFKNNFFLMSFSCWKKKCWIWGFCSCMIHQKCVKIPELLLKYSYVPLQANGMTHHVGHLWDFKSFVTWHTQQVRLLHCILYPVHPIICSDVST